MKTLIEVPDLDINRRLHPDGRISPRIRLEQRIVANLLAHLDSEGFQVSHVYDGEEMTVIVGGTVGARVKEAMELIFNLDESHVYFQDTRDPASRRQWVFLVGGNGLYIVSDYTIGARFSATIDAFNPEVYA